MAASTVRVIRPSSRERPDLMPDRLAELAGAGLQVLYDDLPPDASWPYTASSAENRAHALQRALLEKESTAVWAARGGYGASDLLPLLDWQALTAARPKILIGFSDISALHSAMFAKLNWKGLHAPMPATSLWTTSSPEVHSLLAMVNSGAYQGTFPVEAVSGAASQHSHPQAISGTLFGGCFSVLTSLIGTPYFPASLSNVILFFEDIGENPGRLMRHWNQWLQSGALRGVKALVLGNFSDLGRNDVCLPAKLNFEFARRSSLPVFTTRAFGHCAPNAPVPVGGRGTIDQGMLRWQLDVPSV